MNTIHKFILGVFLITLLSACANLNTAFREQDFGNLKLISIDAKQRVVTHSKGSDRDPSGVTCAEPSPDALSAASAAGSGSLEVASKALGLGYSAAEGAAYIGLRTQTIQLLRDALYRLCEGYAAGAITKERFHRLQRHYQNSMVALLAIEQLTGAVVARPATISGSSGLERGKLLQQAKEAVDGAAEGVTAATKAKTKADADSKAASDAASGAQDEIDKIEKDATKTPDQKAEAKKPFQKLLDDKATKAKAATGAATQLKEANTDLEKAEQFRSDARNAMNISTSATANVQVFDYKPTVAKETVAELGNAVSGIVKRVLDVSFYEEVCTGAMIDALENLKKAENKSMAEKMFELTMKLCLKQNGEIESAVQRIIGN